jgi:DNA repair protein SbcD/Mre11
MRFLHLADVHLGFQQYGLSARFNDFGKAFERAINYAITEKVDAVLIAGDLFHKAAVEPMAFIQAADTLLKTRSAGIPVIVIEGNHDQARYREQISWLDVLAHEGYIILLRSEFMKEEACRLTPWNEDERSGSYIDIHNIRIVGLQWLGASAPNMIPEFAEALSQLPRNKTNFTVMLTHAALEGEIAHLSTYLTYNNLEPLETCVNYLALGHLHKPYQQKDWAYNPGSLEVYDFAEIEWQKGWYDITVQHDGTKKVRPILSHHRPFFSFTFPVGIYTNPSDLFRSFNDQVRIWLQDWYQCTEKPVIEIRLEGELSFERHDLDLKRCEELVIAEGNILHISSTQIACDHLGWK